ncbi:RNA polymerase II mediator complex subunit [Cryomyces antarcticus]|nr:RNA polymerase II mediator complex subunit [Cryomyces antarcticus]
MLQEEIAALESGEPQADEEVEDTAKERDTKSRREELLEAKTEMIKYIGVAQNEVNIALDYVSYLLSKDAPRMAEQTMSPVLKQSVPTGALAYDKWQMPTADKDDARDDELVAKGCKMQILQRTADSLLQAATRLEKDVKRETNYWQQVMSVSEKGWSVCRLPREKHNLGVRFGFSEATREFKDRGLAALRADEEGNVILDQGLASKATTVRVRVQEVGTTVGISNFPCTSDPHDLSNVDLESLIHRARDTLFEEELFHEMTRESQLLTAFGVTMIDSVIHVPTRVCDTTDPLGEDLEDRHILIDLVPSEQTASEVGDHSLDYTAQAVALSLRILLSHTHRQRLFRRSQIPPPLSSAKPPRTYALIIRPLLNHLQHQTALTDLRSYLKSLEQLLQTLGFDTKFSITSTAPSLAGISRAASAASGETSTSAVEALVAALTSPLESEATLALPAPADQPLRFQLRTFVDTPTYGSEYRLTAPATLTPDAPNETEFPRFADLVAHVHYLLSMSLVHCVAAAYPGWTARAREAEAFTAGRGLERKRGIGVVVGRGKVVLRDGGSGRRYEWGRGQGGEGGKTFKEVVAEAVGGNFKSGQS